jgi:magnesium transporter
MKSDYLAYALVDALVDRYFPIVELLGCESIEELQETVLEKPTRERLLEVHEFRKALSQLRRAVWPARDVLARLWRDETGLISRPDKTISTRLLDNTMAIIHLMESYRDAVRDIMDLYLSSLSMRTNEVMRVLTLIACIFAPLTFIVGVYGMNFEGMPELHWKFGYFGVWLIMIIVAVGMLVYFKRQKWL